MFRQEKCYEAVDHFQDRPNGWEYRNFSPVYPLGLPLFVATGRCHYMPILWSLPHSTGYEYHQCRCPKDIFRIPFPTGRCLVRDCLSPYHYSFSTNLWLLVQIFWHWCCLSSFYLDLWGYGSSHLRPKSVVCWHCIQLGRSSAQPQSHLICSSSEEPLLAVALQAFFRGHWVSSVRSLNWRRDRCTWESWLAFS